MEDDWRNPREYFIKGMEEYAGRSIDEVKMLTTHLNDSELINESRVISLAVHKMSLLGKDRRNKEYRKLSNWNAIYHVEKERRGIDDRGWMTPRDSHVILHETNLCKCEEGDKYYCNHGEYVKYAACAECVVSVGRGKE